MALADTGAKAEGGVSRFSASYAKPEKKVHQFTKISKKLSSKQKKERGRRKGEREGRKKRGREGRRKKGWITFQTAVNQRAKTVVVPIDYSLGLEFIGFQSRRSLVTKGCKLGGFD